MPSVRVVPSASLRPDADRTKTLRELAAAAGVQSVVDGSVRRVGDRLRVSVQLIDARSDANLWAGGYEAAASDIVGLQRQVVQAAASAVEQLLSQSDRSPRP
jgi:adenylate cyclase